MRIRWLVVLTLIGGLALTLSGCASFGFIVGTGAIVDRVYDYQNFNEVEISSNFQFEVTQSSAYRVSVSTHENIVDYLDIVQSGQTLLFKFKPGSFSNTDVKATIEMPQINRLIISGASKGSAAGFKSTNDFELSVSGASQVNLSVDAGTTKIDASGTSKINGTIKTGDTRIIVSGASRCDISGTAGSTDVDISGASHFDSPDFFMRNTDISVSGASSAAVHTSGDLNISVTGASSVDYYGSPNLRNVNVSGASRINKK